jgi:hypothetical protein
MLRLRDGQSTLWEELLPAEARLLSTELAAVDNLFDDDRFLSPFVEKFSCPIGRPTIPMETYLRLMYLKHRYGLGYETLVKEVADAGTNLAARQPGLPQPPFQHPARAGPRPGGGSVRGADLGRTRTLVALLNVEGHLLAAAECVEIERAVQSRPVEEVLVAVLAGDEAEAPVRLHLLHGTVGHLDLLRPPEGRVQLAVPLEKLAASTVA